MRELTGTVRLAIVAWAAVTTLFHLYTAGFGFFEPRSQRSLHLLMLLPLAFVLFPGRAASPRARPSIVDWGLAFLAILPNLYSYQEAFRINLRFENVDPLLPMELVMGTLATVLIVEALRRAVTPVLAGLLLLGIAYLFVTEYMPGILHFRHLAYSEIVETMYLLNGMGMYGAITGISSTMVAIFIIFGALIDGSGVGRLFHNLGTKIAGQQAGGPGKVAVVSSALFGTISGSSTANVFTTGAFTIPAMIRLGYRRHFAGGVEAASSVGGQIMPPVMGAGAFVMAEITNIPYTQIMIAATIGATCYFFMILLCVHLEAKRLKLSGVDAADIPHWRVVLKDAHLTIPVGVLLTLLLLHFSPHFAAFWSVVAVVACSWLRKHTRIYPKRLWLMLAAGGSNMVIVALACAGAGMVIACLTVTGMVISISTIVNSLSGGNLLLAGFLLMFTTLVLGMGVPTTAAYIIGAAIGAPILIEMGVPMLGAHMFVFYFSILADATPPVSVASYAAAAIAKADPMRTGFAAFRLALAGFVIGYSYLYTPALLMQGPAIEIIGQVLVNILGLTIVAAGLFGYFRMSLAMPLRLLLIPAGLVITLLELYPVWPRIGIELVLLAGLWFMPKMNRLLSTAR